MLFGLKELYSSSSASDNPVVARLLTSGIVKPLADDDDDRAPRAAG